MTASKKKFCKTIGILGGGGPWAAAYAYTSLLRLVQNQHQAIEDDDYPNVIVYSCALQGMDAGGVRDESSTKQSLVHAIGQLREWGVDILVSACNSTHTFRDILKSGQGMIVVNILTSGAEAACQMKKRRVGVLCSQSSFNQHLHARALQDLGIEAIYLGREQQETVNHIIHNVMGGNEEDGPELLQLIEELKRHGADAVMIGCTELSCLVPRISPARPHRQIVLTLSRPRLVSNMAKA
ncbi:MAG: aspartate/glutamate racemase family protein [Proteobacteria bacterium]|nr:aspartate/glutamate racemase family protein [Pseudomonadota bacterium]